MCFIRGGASSCVFRHVERDITTSVYGDDFTTTGAKDQLDWFRHALEKKYDLVKSAQLGPAETDGKEARILNRVVRWTAEGLEYEADPRQAEQLCRDLDLVGAKSLGSPGCKASARVAPQAISAAPLRPRVINGQGVPGSILGTTSGALSCDPVDWCVHGSSFLLW